jgi:hypothetical protein
MQVKCNRYGPWNQLTAAARVKSRSGFTEELLTQLLPYVGRGMCAEKQFLLALAGNVLAKLAELAEGIHRSRPSIFCDVGYYSNDAFFLRSYVSLRIDNEGEGLALTVDITAPSANESSATIAIESDVCLDDGTMVVAGPSGKFGTLTPGLEAALCSWADEFDAFLKASEVDVLNVLEARMSKKNIASSP